MVQDTLSSCTCTPAARLSSASSLVPAGTAGAGGAHTHRQAVSRQPAIPQNCHSAGPTHTRWAQTKTAPGRTLTRPSREADSRRGVESAPAAAATRRQVTVFWWLAARCKRRLPPSRSHTHTWLPPAVASSPPAGSSHALSNAAGCSTCCNLALSCKCCSDRSAAGSGRDRDYITLRLRRMQRQGRHTAAHLTAGTRRPLLGCRAARRLLPADRQGTFRSARLSTTQH